MRREPLPYRPMLDGISERPDGQHSVWMFDYLFNDDLVPRWILVDVVETREIAKRVAYRFQDKAFARNKREMREAA